MAEQETTIAKLTAFAADPDVKAIVMCQPCRAPPPPSTPSVEWAATTSSSSRACRRKTRPVIAEAADIVMYADEIKQGDSIMETCANWGIDVFIHYSFRATWPWS